MFCRIMYNVTMYNVQCPNKRNQVIKYAQVIECYMRNNFLEKLNSTCGRETTPRPFPKNQNWANFWIIGLKLYTVFFYCMPSWGLTKNMETELQTTFTSFKGFLKNAESSGTSLIFFLLCSIYGSNFIIWLPLLRAVLGNMCMSGIC